MPSSPMELLRYLNSPEYKQAQEEQWARVRSSYQVWRRPKGHGWGRGNCMVAC